MKIKLLILASTLILAACSSTIDNTDINRLSLNMSSKVAQKALGEKPITTFNFDKGHEISKVDVYSYEQNKQQQIFYVAFDTTDRVIYWGKPERFKESFNPYIRTLGAQADYAWQQFVLSQQQKNAK